MGEDAVPQSLIVGEFSSGLVFQLYARRDRMQKKCRVSDIDVDTLAVIDGGLRTLKLFFFFTMRGPRAGGLIELAAPVDLARVEITPI